MDFDVLIVGGGPAGLSTAIRLMQLASKHNFPLSVAVLEKGATIGAHSISGAVFEPRALNELIPDWQQDTTVPIKTAVTEDQFCLLTSKRLVRLPTPKPMHNQGNYIVSLSRFTQWLGKRAEDLGVSIFPGFAGVEMLYNNTGQVIGVATGDAGINKMGQPKDNFQAGIELYAKYTVLAEGARGSLTKSIMKRYKLNADACPQTFGLGIKEVWEVSPEKHHSGRVIHTVGWPLKSDIFGGSFIYHWDKNLISIGFVVGLDYENPYLDIYEEFQQFKQHPMIRQMLEGGRRIAYGARAISEGGFQSIPKLVFPGGLLVGDTAGFLNVPKIKGNHTAMKSGMLAGEAIFKALSKEDGNDLSQELSSYPLAIKQSWIWDELFLVRNIRPAFRYGLWGGLAYSALDTYIFQGKAPFTFKHTIPDYARLKSAKISKKIIYPKHDGVITFDKLTSLQYANVHHDEDEPCHLRLKDPIIPLDINYRFYDVPEQRYCPASVYEAIHGKDGKTIRVQINASNCIHCKACDIKDPSQNIDWVPPEGGGGPNYSDM